MLKTPVSREARVCEKCKGFMAKGEKYYTWQVRISHGHSVTHKRCLNCRPRPSEMASGRAAEILSAVESAEDSISNLRTVDRDSRDVADVENILSDLYDTLEGVKDELDGNISSLEDSFPGHARLEDMQGKSSQLEEMMSIVDSAKDNLPEYVGLAVEEEEPDPDDEDAEAEEKEKIAEAWIEADAQWEAVLDAAQEAISEVCVP